MNNILKSAKRLIKEMEEDNKREVTLYKMIKKYYDDFGTERGDKLLTVIKKNLSHLNAPKQVSDVGVPQYPVSEMMMGPDESVDNIGDSIMNSDLSNMAIKTTYADDFDNFDDFDDFDDFGNFTFDISGILNFGNLPPILLNKDPTICFP